MFFKINKYQLLYCILQYAHAGTCKHWLRTEDFFKKKNRVVIVILRISFPTKFMIKNKWSMFASRVLSIYFGKKTWSHLRCYTYTDYTYSRCLLDI